jgi:manganese transport protein
VVDIVTRLGPGLLVTAAFIGPGTVTTASVAGAHFGFALLWALVFSVLATIVLQEMAARLGLGSGHGLSEALRTSFANPGARAAAIFLVVAAIAFGNAAFETGNIAGAAVGLAALTGVPDKVWVFAVGVAAFALLAVGLYKVIERVLITLVVLMSAVFVVTMVTVKPDLGAMLAGAFVPAIPDGALLTVIALIGTTVVPYNLFLHSSSVQEKWSNVPLDEALRQSRIDTVVSISLGGLITLAIVSTAATAFFAAGVKVTGLASLAAQLEPLLGSTAKYFFALGLMAAGVTSAITAPLAAAYATAGALGWKRDLNDRRFRAVWTVIIVIGVAFAAAGFNPVAAIVFAQAANGILLPVSAVFLLMVMNRRDILGGHCNGLAANLAGGAVVLVATGLGAYQLYKVALAMF